MDEAFEPRRSDAPWRTTVSLVYAGAFQQVHRYMYEMTPADVNLVLNTKLWSTKMLREGGFERSAFENTPEIVDAAVETHAFAKTDALVIGGDLIQAAMGVAWNAELAERVRDKTGVPVFTAMQAVADSLRALSATSVALVSPFPGERSTYLVDFLTESGFDVPVHRGVDTVTNADIRDLPPGMPYELARSALQAQPTVDAVYITCPVWRGTDSAIQRIEDEHRIPVVTMFSSVLWRGLSAAEYSGRIDDYGQLLASLAER